ncbi:hypothetical protein [Algoriphagus sp.]|uniref:hypothetical protein n=1 Tax=Algoriphagus sp. TaxID=1872435 RepID=UPI0025CB8345|nr:hypothetical protein [Algoriphagus sp.]
MTTIKKEISKGFELLVSPSSSSQKDYLLSNFSIPGDLQLLDFHLVKNSKKKAIITFSISKDQKAKSIPLAPFGGFYILEKIQSDSLEIFINEITAYLLEIGINKIEITIAPKPYEGYYDLINYLLFKNGFSPKNLLCHQFFLGRKKIKKWVNLEQSKFQSKTQKQGIKIISDSINNFNFLNDIRQWNMERGYQMNFDENRIILQVSEYPERYFLISVLDLKNPIAHCLAVKLFPDTLYYFLSAINPKSHLKNGGDILLYQLFKLANEEKVRLIDLGSSDLGNDVNHPLMFFKSRFANDFSNKITWAKNLS